MFECVQAESVDCGEINSEIHYLSNFGSIEVSNPGKIGEQRDYSHSRLQELHNCHRTNTTVNEKRKGVQPLRRWYCWKNQLDSMDENSLFC